MKETLMAIIRNPVYGFQEGRLCLSFTTWIDENECALQVLSEKKANELLSKHKISDVSKLDGMPCHVAHDTSTALIVFMDLLKI